MKNEYDTIMQNLHESQNYEKNSHCHLCFHFLTQFYIHNLQMVLCQLLCPFVVLEFVLEFEINSGTKTL